MRPFFKIGAGILEQTVGAVEIPAIPCPQAIAQAIDLAVTGQPGQRYGVEIVEDNAFACVQRFLTILIGAQRGRNHLPQLVVSVARATTGGMAEFLDLRRQRTAAGACAIKVKRAHRLAERDVTQAHPINGRVAQRTLGVKQIVVLDIEQGIDQHRRNVLEARVLPLWIAAAVKRRSGAVAQA